MSAQGTARLTPSPGEPRGPLSRLLESARSGDDQALGELKGHLEPIFWRWARARSGAEGTIPEIRKWLDGALTRRVRETRVDYLRDGTLLVELREELNRRIQPLVSLESTVPLHQMTAYEHGLLQLSALEREAAVLHLEMRRDFERLAVDLGLPSAEDARLLFRQAFLQLAGEMGDDL